MVALPYYRLGRTIRRGSHGCQSLSFGSGRHPRRGAYRVVRRITDNAWVRDDCLVGYLRSHESGASVAERPTVLVE
jgi:hypothetical protein